MKDLIATPFFALFAFGYTFGPFFGLWAAIDNGSFVNALLSLIIPFYGMLYFFM